MIMKRLLSLAFLVAFAGLSFGAQPIAGFAYSNDGFSMRAVDEHNPAAPGEAVFPTYATPQQLTAAFPNYAAIVAAQSVPADLATRLKNGVTIVSQGAVMPSTTFALDQTTQAQISGIASSIALLGKFPNGTMADYPYPSQAGQPVAFPTIDAFKNFFGAYEGYLQQMNQTAALLQAGQPAEYPSSTVTVP